jgi:hypothetical protein
VSESKCDLSALSGEAVGQLLHELSGPVADQQHVLPLQLHFDSLGPVVASDLCMGLHQCVKANKCVVPSMCLLPFLLCVHLCRNDVSDVITGKPKQVMIVQKQRAVAVRLSQAKQPRRKELQLVLWQPWTD